MAALEEGGGYDLARGFETMIEGQKAIDQSIHDLQTALVTQLSMNKDMSIAPGRATAFGQQQAQISSALRGGVMLSPPSQQQVSQQQVQAQAGSTILASPDQGGAGAGTVVAGAPASAQPSQPASADPAAGQTGPAQTQADTQAAAEGASGGSGGGLVNGLLRAIPGGSFVMDAMDFANEQRDKNARYQAIEGGANSDAFATRRTEETTVLSQRGMFNDEDARKLFYGATSLGYNSDYGGSAPGHEGEGYGRQDMMDFAYKQKSATGAGPDEILQHMDTFARSSGAGLAQFSDALIQVGDSAAKAGVNAELARAQFDQMFGQATQAGFGMGATGYSQVVTETNAGYGRAFQSNVDTSQMTSQSNLRMQAAMGGTTYNQMMLSEMKGGSAAAMGQDAAMKKLIGMFPQDQIQWLKDQIAANPDMGETEINALIPKFLSRTNMDFEQIRLTANAFTGMDYKNIQAVMTAIIRSLMGQGYGDNLAKANQVEDYTKLGVSTSGVPAYDASGPYTPSDATTTSATGQAYNDMVSAGGEEARVGNFEQIMSRVGAENQDTQQIKVSGKTMSLQDAIADPKAMAKIAQGKGKMVGGEFDKQRISTVAGTDQPQEGDTQDTTAVSNATVTIELSEEAKTWFKQPTPAEISNANGEPVSG